MNTGQQTPALTSHFTLHCFFFFFAGYICEYQYYFPVRGKLRWMVARLQEEILLSWLKELFSILSLNQRAGECVPESHSCVSVSVWVKCGLHFDEKQIRPAFAAWPGHVREKKSSRCADKWSQTSAECRDCNQTINQKSLSLHPISTIPDWFLLSLVPFLKKKTFLLFIRAEK